MKKSAYAAFAALAPLMLAANAAAQEASEPTSVEQLIVTGEIVFRNRTEQPAPTLSYDLEYFQRFEPLTAGDAMKRVPSVTFLSDVLESDGARLRGLDPGYTQILINGERVPGAGVDRSFFVDRIPAELIERVEVVRSASANRSGDAVAGALNIVLRDGYSLDGGYLRAGAIHFDDGKIRETLGAVWGGEVGPGRLLLGANIQGRRNPKEKYSLRYDEPGGDIDNSEVQSDLRDGTDYSINGSYEVPAFGGELELNGFFVRTDRSETERSIEYLEGLETDANIQTVNDQVEDIRTDSWSLSGRFAREMLGGETVIKLAYAELTDDRDIREDETAFDDDDVPYPEDDVFESALGQEKVDDSEWQARLAHERSFGALQLEFGLDYVKKDRESTILETETEVEIDDPPATRPPIPGPYDDFEPVAGGLSTIEETRLDPYLMLSGDTGRMSWEAGLRYETTETDVTDLSGGAPVSVSNDYAFLLPSAHLRFDLTEQDRLNLSVARTVRRPNFNFITPALLEEEYGDNDFLGNPNLDPEHAWGLDVGVERRLGTRGVIGLNVFYRRVSDLIEIVNTGAYSATALDDYDDAYEEAIDDGASPAEAAEEAAEELVSFVLSADNVGDGSVYGVEFDLSTPLTVVGMPNTGVFLNYSWLESDADDRFGSRRFNDQSDYVFNVGFIQDLPVWNAAFGATYRKQGDAFGRIVGEEVVTTYGADLEVFVEKRFGENLVVRLTGQNLLNASKDETFHKFDTIEDQIDRDYDEYELETEEAGPVFQLVARMTF